MSYNSFISNIFSFVFSNVKCSIQVDNYKIFTDSQFKCDRGTLLKPDKNNSCLFNLFFLN